MTKIWIADTTKCWAGGWSNRNSHSSLLGVKMVQPLWKTMWPFLIKLNILSPYGLAIAILGIYPKLLENYVHAEPTRGCL